MSSTKQVLIEENPAPTRSHDVRLLPGIGGYGSSVISSYSNFFNQEFNPYHASFFRTLDSIPNRAYFPDFFKSYRTNTYTAFACDYLNHQILDRGWTVEGDGAKKIKRFFSKDDTYDKINYTEGPLGGAVTYGIGALDLKTANGSLVATRPLNPLRLGGIFDPNEGRVRYYYSDDKTLRGSQSKDGMYLRDENLFINTLNYDPFDPFPTAPLRSALLLFTILYDMNGDIAEAVKRVAYAPFIVYVNTDGVDESQKNSYIREFSKELEGYLSAGTNLCLDDVHKAGTAGSLGGGGGALSLPVDRLMEPILSIALTRFSIPIGLVSQTGANKSILEKQMEASQKQILAYRERFQGHVERLFPYITGKDAELVWKLPLPSSKEMDNLRKHYIELLQAGVIDAGFARDKLKINLLTGNTLFEKEGVLIE